MNGKHYILINEKENAIDSLERSLDFLILYKKKDMYFKWFLIAFQHAVYSFMIISLVNPDNSGIWEKEEVKDNEGFVESKNNKIISFLKAFTWIQDKTRTGNGKTRPFIGQDYHRHYIKELNTLRNELAHYHPKHWMLGRSYIIWVILPVLEVINFCVFESRKGCYDKRQLAKIKKTTEGLKNFVADNYKHEFESYKSIPILISRNDHQ